MSLPTIVSCLVNKSVFISLIRQESEIYFCLCKSVVTLRLVKSFLTENLDTCSHYYDVVDVFDNDRSAIMSRIDYIERNEPRRSFLNIF